MSRKRRDVRSEQRESPDATTGVEPIVSAQSLPAVERRSVFESPRLLTWIGVGLLLGVLVWWGASLMQKPLPHAVPAQPDYSKQRFTYVPFMPFVGLDFHHNYAAARAWREGRDPYAELRGD